jgi:hypothetical protein
MDPDVTAPNGSPVRSRATERVPPFWAGCDAVAWWRLLKRSRVAVDRSRWRMAAFVSASSAVQTALGFVQRVLHGREITETLVRNPPIFVLGHWRSGTTLLHELLASDPRHAAPTTYDCFNPHHFLLTRSWLPALLQRFAPSRRPMDAMAAGWERPQEDEFGLVLLGQPSPYEQIAFPNVPGAGAAALELHDLSPRAVCAWERTFRRFVRALTLASRGRRLVLKSPPHTARIPTLLKLYPGARFVHLVRDPYAVYASTLNLWRVLCTAHGLQRPAWEILPEHVLNTFARMDRAFESTRALIPNGHLHELRYEDLVRDPVTRTEIAYRELSLGDFGAARRSVEEHLSRVRGHESGTHVVTAEERRAINERWADYFRRYGYPRQPA